MSWTEKQILIHKFAASKLDKIMEESFLFIKQRQNNVSEIEVQKFIIKSFHENGLVGDEDDPIVAFGKNTSFIHYFPSKQCSISLQKEFPIMIDLWARESGSEAPFADITWVGFFGDKIPGLLKETYKAVFEARDLAVEFIKKSLAQGLMPTGRQIDDTARKSFEKKGLHDKFLHTTGHSLGLLSCHGIAGGNLSQNNENGLHRNIGYTIEPGLYHEGEFGARSEIDFYINQNYELIITTKKQQKLVQLG